MNCSKIKPVETILLILLLAFIVANIGTELNYVLQGSQTCVSMGLKDCDKRKSEYLHNEFRNILMKIIVDFLNLVLVLANIVCVNLLKKPWIPNVPRILFLFSLIFSVISLSAGISSIQQDDAYNKEWFEQQKLSCLLSHNSQEALKMLEEKVAMNQPSLQSPSMEYQSDMINLQRLLRVDINCKLLTGYKEAYQEYKDSVIALAVINLILSLLGTIFTMLYGNQVITESKIIFSSASNMLEGKSQAFQLPIVEKHAKANLQKI